MSSCLHCGEALDELARATVHVNGNFRCATGEWAESNESESLESYLHDAYMEGYREAQAEAEWEWEGKVDDAFDEGKADGIREGSREVISRIQEAVDHVRASDVYLTAVDAANYIEESLIDRR